MKCAAIKDGYHCDLKPDHEGPHHSVFGWWRDGNYVDAAAVPDEFEPFPDEHNPVHTVNRDLLDMARLQMEDAGYALPEEFPDDGTQDDHEGLVT